LLLILTLSVIDDLEEEIEDNKGVIKRKDTQYNDERVK
jgi:hypothetical protein